MIGDNLTVNHITVRLSGRGQLMLDKPTSVLIFTELDNVTGNVLEVPPFVPVVSKVFENGAPMDGNRFTLFSPHMPINSMVCLLW